MRRCLDTRYLKSIRAGVKVAEILVLAAAWVATLLFDQNVLISGSTFSRIRFFVLVTGVAWIVETIVFILLLTRVTRNLPVPWPWVNLIIGVFFGLFCLLAAAFMSSSIDNMKGIKRLWYDGNKAPIKVNQCEYLNQRQSKTSCIALETGVVFGFFATVLFIADVVVNIRELRRGTYKHEPPQTAFSPDNVTISTSAAAD